MSLYEALTPYDLELSRRRKPDWIVEGLIMEGDQVILSGAPKSYKSFLASQLATALASGSESFLCWKVPLQRKVLYLSLEMTPDQTAERVLKQLEALAPNAPLTVPESIESSSLLDTSDFTGGDDFYDEEPISHNPEDGSYFDPTEGEWVNPLDALGFWDDDALSNQHDGEEEHSERAKYLKSIPLIHVFSINGRHSVDILDNEQKPAPRASSWDSLHRIISEVDPDVVIFDSLVRFFSGDENSNPVMSKVMQQMRKLCLRPKPSNEASMSSMPLSEVRHPHLDRYRTSLIIHHNRKESQGFERNYSAAMMRGASAIHSEADLIISTFLVNKDTQISMNFSARKIRAPEYKIIELDPETLLMREAVRFDKTEAAIPVNAQRIPYILDVLEKAAVDSEYLSWPDIQRRVEQMAGSPDEGLDNTAELYSKTFKEAFADILDESKRKYRIKEGHDRQAVETKLKTFFTDKALRGGNRGKRKRN